MEYSLISYRERKSETGANLKKWININQGEEYIRLRGIMRPTDISADNTIASTRVANAQIQYSGDSTLADSNNMGWLAKLFNSPWMPF